MEDLRGLQIAGGIDHREKRPGRQPAQSMQVNPFGPENIEHILYCQLIIRALCFSNILSIYIYNVLRFYLLIQVSFRFVIEHIYLTNLNDTYIMGL